MIAHFSSKNGYLLIIIFIIHYAKVCCKKRGDIIIKHNYHFHGSDLEAIEKCYHIKKEDIISFSANVNPLGISYQLRSTLADNLDAITTYPDREYTALRTCIATYAGTQPENIIVGNGSTELISLFIQTKHPKKALVLGPTYSEYEREIALGGGTTLYYPLKEENGFHMDVEDFCSHLSDQLELLVLCNPNNPTSTAITCSQMRRILDACLQYGIFVMVDETYVEFAPEEKDVTSIPLTNYYTNLIILRGTSKFFAAPGLRLGYAVTGNQDLIKAIDRTTFIKNDNMTINKLQCSVDEVVITNKSQEIGESREVLNAEWTGDPLNISFSGNYVMDAAKALKDDEIIIEFTGEMKPFILKNLDDDSVIQLVLPVRTYN